jgi:hypothetical protein
MTNYKPHADARDKAFWARACLIEFGIRFVEQPHAPNERQADVTLKETLKQERSGILAWLVRGCLAWQQQGLEVPPSVLMATDRYREEEDKLVLFVQECCLVEQDAVVNGGALFKAYREWYEGSQFGGRGVNSKLFGEEMKKRFTWKVSRGRVVYQEIGLLTREDEHPSLFDEQIRGEGGEGNSNFLPKMKRDPPYRGKNMESPSPPSPLSSVAFREPALEAIVPDRSAEGHPHHTLTTSGEPHPCTTRYEKRHQGAHQAIATHFGAGCWWCEKCEPQRTWMEFGEANTYPQIDVPEYTFKVPPGRESWLRFAQEAGYTFVGYALEAAHHRESFEL